MNPGWSLRDRAFLSALAFSLLWHCFWFFSISITVAAKKEQKPHPKIISLGPVLDDTIFRTLVETKPELSETFYRRPADFTQPIEPAVRTMERISPGEVVSLPFGKRVLNSIRNLMSGPKPSPDNEFTSRLPLGYLQEVEGLEGDLKSRAIVSKPEEPRLPPGFHSFSGDAEIAFEIEVDAEGDVRKITTLESSGRREIDLLWENYLKGWRFEPLPGAAAQKGRMRFRTD